MIPTKVMAKLATLGLSEEQVEAVATMLTEVEDATQEAVAQRFEAVIEESREKGRERWRRWDEKRRSNVGKRQQTLANTTRQLARADDTTSTSPIEPQVKTSHTSDVDAFKAGLTPDVSEEVLVEFVKVRRKKRGALTGFAAKLFREDAAKCGMTVADAAKECVRSSWITVKPEYFTSRQRAGPGPAPPKDTPANAARRRLEEMQNERRNGSETDDHQPAAGVIPGNLIRLVG